MKKLATVLGIVVIFMAAFLMAAIYTMNNDPVTVKSSDEQVSQGTQKQQQNVQKERMQNSLNEKSSNTKKYKEIQGLVELQSLDASFVIDMIYATDKNFTKQRIYSSDKCILQLATAKKLIDANNEFKKLGYTLKIYDAYRPLVAQKLMWSIFPNEDFVAPPTRGSIHNRGGAVDVTLVDQDGRELPMPSEYDDFSERAGLCYKGGTKEETANRELLGTIMEKHGFNRLDSEWWHFTDSDYKKYPVLDVRFEEFE